MTILDNEIKALAKKSWNSSFNRNNYRVNIDYAHFIDSMLLHTWSGARRTRAESALINPKEWLKRVTPEFQRANTKWSKSMKLRFIENMLSGAKVELLLFRMKVGDDSQILDGLQRTSAIIDFIQGKVKPFGYKYDDMKKHLRSFPCDFVIKIYTFSMWGEVGSFYIDMNENITHSKKDIQKAKDWFLVEHGVIL